MNQFLGKITLEQVINNSQVLLPSMSVTGGNGRNRRKSWFSETRIARHKLTVLKIVYLFTIDHLREIKFDKKTAWLRNVFIVFPPRFELGTLRVWSARDDHYTTETCLWSTCSLLCGILLFSFSVNKASNACFCPGSNWGTCARRAHVMTATLQKQSHARNTLQTSPVSIL